MPTFYKVFAAATIALLAVCACSKSDNSSDNVAAPAQSSADAGTAAPAATAATGGNAKAFTANCASCHGADGKGSPGAFPPLAGNPVVTGDPTKVIHIVKYGLSGKVVVAGHSYNGIMPPWGSQLSDGDIASAITYIRSSWGNSASGVTAAQVSAVAK